MKLLVHVVSLSMTMRCSFVSAWLNGVKCVSLGGRMCSYTPILKSGMHIQMLISFFFSLGGIAARIGRRPRSQGAGTSANCRSTLSATRNTPWCPPNPSNQRRKRSEDRAGWRESPPSSKESFYSYQRQRDKWVRNYKIPSKTERDKNISTILTFLMENRISYIVSKWDKT